MDAIPTPALARKIADGVTAGPPAPEALPLVDGVRAIEIAELYPSGQGDLVIDPVGDDVPTFRVALDPAGFGRGDWYVYGADGARLVKAENLSG